MRLLASERECSPYRCSHWFYRIWPAQSLPCSCLPWLQRSAYSVARGGQRGYDCSWVFSPRPLSVCNVGTCLLVSENTRGLKRALGVVVLAAGAWFLYGEWRKQHDALSKISSQQLHRGPAWWWSIPAGFASGTLGGLFGTGGPPVIICLRAYHLDKSTFRATILWFFLVMSVVRAGTYTHGGVFTLDRLLAAVWLLPASLVGMVIGMFLHVRISERFFAVAVAGLLVLLGFLLIIGGGK